MHLTNEGLSYILVFVFEAQYRIRSKSLRDALSRTNKQKGYMKKLKEEFQPGGSKRHVILDKAVQYLKDPRFGLQGDKHSFLTEQLGLSESEYLTCLNTAAGGDYWQ